MPKSPVTFAEIRTQAKQLLDEVRASVSTWQDVARRHGLSEPEIKRMSAVVQG